MFVLRESFMTLNLIRPETQTSENSEHLILFLTMVCLDLTLIAKTTKAVFSKGSPPAGPCWYKHFDAASVRIRHHAQWIKHSQAGNNGTAGNIF